MKKFNKLIVLLSMLVLMVGVVGCSSNEEEPSSTMDLTDSNVVVDGVNAYFANMPEHIYKVNQSEFLDRVKAGDDIVVIDIRQADAYAEGHVKGAINLPWGTAISDSITKITQDKEVFIYCYSGQTAGQAVMTLNLAGINARSVNLGWNFGISKVEGYEEATETTVNEFGSETYDVAEEVQTVLADYYAGLADVKETTYANYKISEDNLAAIMDAEEDFYLLSIRSAADFAEGHIQGAENIPWGAGMEKQFSILPTDKKIVVYCYSGQTAGQTVAGLKLLGYDAVSLNGGIGVGANAPLGWINQEYETVK